MSHVDNWILLPDYLDGSSDSPAMLYVNRRLEELDEARMQQFRTISRGEAGDNWGGTKWPEVDAYGMACNHLPVSAVLRAIREAPWRAPANGLAMVMTQEGGGWQVWRLNELPPVTPPAAKSPASSAE